MKIARFLLKGFYLVLLFFLLIFTIPRKVLATVPADSHLPTVPNGYTWNMVWNDEFSGNSLDQTKWNIDNSQPAPTQNYWFQPDAISVSNSNLVIKTYYDAANNRYVGGTIRTDGKFLHSFGYYEAKIKFPTQQGQNPAFWIFNWSCSSAPDPVKCEEIDIIEKPWLDNNFQQTIHWGGYGENHKSVSKQTTFPSLDDGNYHTIGVWWKQNPDEYVFYIDGVETFRTTPPVGISQTPEFIMLDNIPSTWVGDITKAKLPDYMYVDYVRVYDLSSNNAHTAMPTSTPTYLKGDINKDGNVDILDYGILINAFGTNNAAADLNGDGVVNILDYNILVTNYGK